MMAQFLRVAAITAALAVGASQALAQTATPVIDAARVLSAPPATEAVTETAWTPERITQARADLAADPFPAFSSIMGAGFTRAQMPATAAVFDRLMRESGPVVSAAKAHWPRPRPVQSAAPNCPGALPAGHTASDSFPSGHATIGWLWALTLAELAPGKADDVLARGRDYGDSRLVCGVHWPSDVTAGRDVASALVARLHADPEYRTALDVAREEVRVLLTPAPAPAPAP